MIELKHSKGLDWNFYNEEFPNRYTKESKLDRALHRKVSDIMDGPEWCRILDVGGGPNLTPALWRLIEQSKYEDVSVSIDLLDPFVRLNQKSDRIEINQVDWDYITYNVAEKNRNSDQPYDLIICRGSLNYLTIEQIGRLGRCLRSGGILLANSFAEPAEVDREITTGNGNKGREIATYYTRPDSYIIMEHKLEVSGDVITHESFYHNPTDVIRALGPDGVTAEFYGTNSVLYKYKY